MSARARFLAAFLCLAAGAGLWLIVRDRFLGPSDAEWQAQIAQDAADLVQILGHEPWVEDDGRVFGAWEKRKALYDDERLGELRARLEAYVEADMAAHFEAKDVYLSGRRPENASGDLRGAYEALRRSFPARAESWIERWRKELLDPAYLNSPQVARGDDPDRIDFAAIHDTLREEWLPNARERIERLTRP